MSKKKYGKKGRNKKMVTHMIYIALVAIVAVGVMLNVISGYEIDKTYKNLVKEELKATATHLDSQVNSTWDGDWAYEDGVLSKGGQEVSEEYEELMDQLREETNIDYTIFYGDTRVVTTLTREGSSERLINTQASEAVVSATLKGGEDYYSANLTIEGKKYMGYYVPLKNDDGSIVGMVFSGRDCSDVTSAITNIILILSLITVGMVVLVALAGAAMARKTSATMHGIADELDKLSHGQINLTIDEKTIARKDELGILADGAQTLSHKLGEVIRSTVKTSGELKREGSELSCSAGQASEASDQVSIAIEDIARGAADQAGRMETAASNTQTIGNEIENIASNASQLDTYALEMKDACDNAMGALEHLIGSSRMVQESVQDIGQTINSTNESAKSISAFSEAITNIASQTNLLSLNASIEAARAGEAGKGFAVVASEIGKLAIESSNSAEEINRIVAQLVSDSEASVEVMKKLNESFGQQSEQLDSTKVNMQTMSENVSKVSESSENIADLAGKLTVAKDELVGIVAALTDISTRNAASTQQTSASMQKLHSAFTTITESAAGLQTLADDLTETISYFKDEEHVTR